MSDPKDVAAVLEIAVYTVEDPEALAARHHQVHDHVRSADGHLGSLALRQVEDSQVFADVVAWRDLAAAKAASAALETDPTLAWFRQSIVELALFGHFRPVTGPVAGAAPEAGRDLLQVLGVLGAAPLVEIAVYRPVASSRHAPLHRLLHETKLPTRDGVVGHAGLISAQDTGRADGAGGRGSAEVGDLIAWASRAAMESTQAALMADPDLAGFFDPDQEVVVFALFEPSAHVGRLPGAGR